MIDRIMWLSELAVRVGFGVVAILGLSVLGVILFHALVHLVTVGIIWS